MDALRSWIEPQTIPVNFVLVPDREPPPNIIKGKYHSFPQIAPGDNLGLARAIRALFQNRFHWCAFAAWRQLDGSLVQTDIRDGYAFCLNGAAWAHDRGWSRAQRINFMRFMGFEPQNPEKGYGTESAHFNNHQGYEAVIRRLDRVIAAHS
jgi:hypothetical protein